MAVSSEQQHRNISALTSEEINFLRLANLILRVAPRAVRVQFDKEFGPLVLQNTLNQNRWKVLDPLKNKRIINKAQWDLLFPQSGTACSKSFDLTMMICLIRNLTPIPIEDLLPVTTDTSQGADFSRLKHYRNQISHWDGILSDTKFEECWTDISQAIVRLGGTSFLETCSDLKVSRMNNNDKEILTELRNMELSNDPVPKGIRKINGEIIEDWEKDKVAETRAIKRIAELIETENVVVAVGSSGCGKSTSIHYVALQLYHQHGFDIIHVYSPEEVRQYYNPECRQVFVVDDICGKSTIDINLVNCWGMQLTEIQKVLKDQRVKILSSCRTHIFQNRLFKNLSSVFSISCDLTSDYKLTCEERKDIASIYLTKDDMESIEGTFCFESRHQMIFFPKLFQQFDFFPLLCSIFQKQKVCNARDFFLNPIKVLKDDMTLLMNANDQKTIATLMLFTVYNNTIDENVLARTSDIKQVLGTISDNFHLQQCFSIHCVKTELNDVNRSYVKKIGFCSYRIIHDKIYEILVLFLGEHKFDALLELAHTNIIRDMFLLNLSHETEQINEDHVEGFVKVSKDNEQNYFNRLIRDINDGFVENVLNNKQMKYSSFRRKLIQKIKNESNINSALKKLSKVAVSTLFVAMIRLGFIEMVEILIEFVELNDNNEDGFYPEIYIRCTTNVMILSSNHGIDPGDAFIITPGIEKSPLFVASKNGYTEIVKLLLEHGSDPTMDVWRRTESTPLYEASKQGYIDVVKLLLFYKADPNLNILKPKGHLISTVGTRTHTQYFLSPLCKAIYNEHSEVVNILLDHKADANFRGWDGTPLFLAVIKRNTEIVKSLLIHEADPNASYGGSCLDKPTLYIASENGDIEIVRLLLNYKGNPNVQSHYYKESPLHIAIQKDHIEIARLLISHNANLHALDKSNKTPMFFALKHKNIAALGLLVATKKIITVDTKHISSTILYYDSKYGESVTVKSMLEQINVDGNYNSHNEYKPSTPLCVASLQGNIELVTILLDYNCDPNITSMYKETMICDASALVQFFCAEYASRDISKTHNLTPVYIAAMFGHSEIVQLLIEKNCNLSIADKDKGSQEYMCDEPILYVAASNGHAKIVKLLLENGCNPNLCNKFNTTALHAASCQGHFETVKVLLENNSDPCIINKKNDSLLFETAEGRMEILEVGLKYIFEFECFESMYKKTPLCIATYLGHKNIVELLNNIDSKTEIL